MPKNIHKAHVNNIDLCNFGLHTMNERFWIERSSVNSVSRNCALVRRFVVFRVVRFWPWKRISRLHRQQAELS